MSKTNDISDHSADIGDEMKGVNEELNVKYRDEAEFESINVVTEAFVIAFYIAVAVRIIVWLYFCYNGSMDSEL